MCNSLVSLLVVVTLFAVGGQNSYGQTVTHKPLPAPLERSTHNGSGAGPEVVEISGIHQGLAGFLFNFHGNDTDKEIERIKVMTYINGLEIEYSPTLPDHHPYDWRTVHQELPAGTRFYESERYCGKPSRQVMLRGEETQGVPVLVGFYFVRGGQDKVSIISARIYRDPDPSVDAVYVHNTFSNESNAGMQRFCYKVRFAMVPENKVIATGIIGSQGPYIEHQYVAKRVTVSELVATYPVMQGFDLMFLDDNEDDIAQHKLDEIGVFLQPGHAIVWYNDRNDDDKFVWTVWYADVAEWQQPPKQPWWKRFKWPWED